jgi:hypothetical protein
MTDTATVTAPKKVTKKELRKVVYEKLAGALAEFKSDISEKKFENRLKKASKLFAVDIARATRRSKKETTTKISKKNALKVQ